MSGLDNLTEDYATRPVPYAATYSGWRVGFVIGGIGIALPALVSGAEVGLALGFVESLWAFIVSGVLVAALALMTGWVGMRSRLSTYMILRFSFGDIGARAVSATFALAQFGWFGVNASFFGAAAEAVGRDALGLELSSSAYIAAGGALMTAATVFGYKALDKLGLVFFPIIVATLAAMTARSFTGFSFAEMASLPGTGDLSFGQAITVLAGGIIVGVLLVPDLTRYARGPRDLVIAVAIALAVIEPLVHVAASGPALRFGETEPLALLTALGFSAYALFFLIFASVTTNAVNLYGSGLSLAAIYSRAPEYAYVILAGVVGALLAILGIADSFIDFLIWQSVVFSSVMGVYVVDFFLIRRGDYDLAAIASLPAISWPAFLAWGLGAGLAAASFTGRVTLTGIANLDGVITAALVYFVAARLGAGRRSMLEGAP